MRSPLKDNLGFRCATFVKQKIPPASVIHSFLCYAGTLELSLATDKRFVVAHTNNYPLYEFWACLLRDPHRVRQVAECYHPLPHLNAFEVLKKEWHTYQGHYTRAGLFFLLNNCSSLGDVSKGEYEPANLTPSVWRRLSSFEAPNLYMMLDEGEDYLSGIAAASEAEYLLFPVGAYNFNLFEEGKSRGADATLVHHQKLRDKLSTLQQKWVVAYKYHPRVLKEYKNYDITMISKYGHPTQRKDLCEDIVIANF